MTITRRGGVGGDEDREAGGGVGGGKAEEGVAIAEGD